MACRAEGWAGCFLLRKQYEPRKHWSHGLAILPPPTSVRGLGLILQRLAGVFSENSTVFALLLCLVFDKDTFKRKKQ